MIDDHVHPYVFSLHSNRCFSVAPISTTLYRFDFLYPGLKKEINYLFTAPLFCATTNQINSYKAKENEKVFLIPKSL